MSTEEFGKETRSEYLWEQMSRLGVVATTPGSRELSEWNLFSEFLKDGTIPVVSSNLTLKTETGNEPVGDRYLVVEAAGVRIGVIGLLGANAFVNTRLPDGVLLGYQDPAEAAQEMVAELQGKAEIIVLLSQLTTDNTDVLLGEVPGIDVALYGQRAPYVSEAELVGQTIVNMTGSRGQYAGKLVLIVSPRGDILDFGAHNHALDGRTAKNPEIFARATEIENAAKELKAIARERKVTEPETEASPAFFLGAETCKRCHASEYEQWTKTPHAHAFASLDADHGMKKTEDCARCHVTGYDHPTGYVPASDSPNLENVQCEACHGPGTEHVRTGGQATLGEAVCTGCHTGEFAKDWDFETYYELVKHDPR